MASGHGTTRALESDIARHNTSGEPTVPECVTGSPTIKFARFKNATLELFQAPIESTDYIAFSHVWGEWAWCSIEGIPIPYEVKASEEKARFIANDLPTLVGDDAFWMDTLTVDQRNPAEVSEIVDAIPDIFRMARKTVAVRECDGLYDCCIAAVAGFEDFDEFAGRWLDHSHEHDVYLCAESYLQRLWTLQECLLSHTIEFVVGSDNQPKTLAVRGQPSDAIDKCGTLAQALLGLSHSFSGSQGKSAVVEFMKAYVHGGTVVNLRSAKRGVDEDIHSTQFLLANIASSRSATMPRDYVFATMPSFPWYTYPKKDALSMSFGEIYLDLYQQAQRSGHAFTCRFTRSMLDLTCTDSIDGWLPSQHLPSPTMLGDFLKLMGKRVPEASNASSPHVHITSDVQIMELESECSPDIFISRLEACFEHFQIQWQESLQGSELSRFGFGDHPDYSWTLKHADAASCGWIHTYPEDATRVPDDGDHSRIRIAPGLGFMEDESVADPSNFDETEQEARMYEAGEYVPLFVQARKILDYTFTTHMVDQMNEAPRAHLASFKRRMQGVWSVPLLRTVLLLAAMVNCRIPLSAAAWVNKLFVPIYIHHSEDLLSVGLLAKHARQPKHQRQDPLYLLCVGQHLPSAGREPFGQDLLLVDPETKVPVGLAPDMDTQLHTNEEFTKIALSLYNGCCTYLGDNKLGFTPRLLSDEPSVPRERLVS